MKIKLNVMLSLSLLLILLVGCETRQVTVEEVIRPEEVRFYTHTPGDLVDKGTLTATSNHQRMMNFCFSGIWPSRASGGC